jgi:formyltetrahydrofolate deformylase
MKNELILKIQCNDQPGIIAAITSLISQSGGNILDLDQHTATDIDTFMLKTNFKLLPGFKSEKFESDLSFLAEKYNMEWELFDPLHKQQVAIFVSKTSHCLYELLIKHKDGELPCDFPVVVSNHPDLEKVAHDFNIPFYHVSSKQPKEDQETEFNKIANKYEIDLIVMARYMQILRKEFTEQWKHRIINIHHGFLPAFQGAKPYHQAWKKGVKLIGATAHFATEDLDQGPIISQDVAKITDTYSIKEFVQLGKDIERKVLFEGLKTYLEQRVFVLNNRTFLM